MMTFLKTVWKDGKGYDLFAKIDEDAMTVEIVQVDEEDSETTIATGNIGA